MPPAIASQVVMDANTVTTITSNINSLYSGAISQLITYTVGLMAFVGILLPIVITYIQNRQFKSDHKAMAEKISLEIQVAKEALIADLKSELAKEIQQFEKKLSDMKNEMKSDINKNKSAANAKAHHLQANTNIRNSNYTGAFADCAISIIDYATAKDEANLRKVLDIVLIKNVFPNMKKVDFEKDDDLQKWYENVTKSIEGLNENGRYADSLKSLKDGYKGALSR